MSGSRSLEKPGLASQPAFWVDQSFLSEEVKQQLKLLMHLGKDQRHTLPQCAAFLDDCAEIAQLVCITRQDIALDKERKQLRALEAGAKRLLGAINLTSQQTRDAFTLHSDSLMHLSTPPVALPKEVIHRVQSGKPRQTLLSVAWDYVAAVELVAGFAASKLKPSKQYKPEQINARHLAMTVVTAYRKRFKVYPPSNQAGWFVGFMAAFGKHLELPCGPRIVARAIKEVADALTVQKRRST